MGQILHNSNSGVFMFQICVGVVSFGLSVTQTTKIDSNMLISSAEFEALKQRFSVLENRQASTEADINQVNAYIGSVGQLITRYTEIESKFDKILEFNGEMQAMKQEIQLIKQSVDGVIKMQELQHERLRLCQPEVAHSIEEVTQAVREVQSNVAELSDTLQVKKGFEEIKHDMISLKEDVQVRLDNISILHDEDNITLTEMFAEGYSQLTENMNELEFKCQQNYSALQQIHALEFSTLQSNVSRLDNDLSTHLNNTETTNEAADRHQPCGSRTDYIYKLEFEICYKIYSSPLDTTAGALIYACAKDGADLIKINSPEIQDFFAQELGKLQESFTYVLIQGNDEVIDGAWKYDDGSPLSYYNWNSAQPDRSSNQNVIGMKRNSNFRWHDLNSGSQYSFIYVCQIRAM